MKTTHVRAALHKVLAILDHTVGGEGFRRSDMTLEPRVVTVGEETMTLPPEVPPNARRIVVAERAGWISIADDPGAMTDWGEKLSTSMPEVPVLTLDGECDHAFYSSVVVYEGGAVTHRSDVPSDAVHEADGRHRIRPVFLAAYFPDAKRALEEGIVVNPLGGEDNVLAVGNALSIPNALLSAYDAAEEGRVAHLFEYDADLAPEPEIPGSGASPFEGALAAMLGQLTSSLAGHLNPDAPPTEAPDPHELGKMLMASLGAMMGQAAQEEPLTLIAPSSSEWSGFANDDLECHTQFRLSGGTADGARSTHGLTIRITGTGVEHIEITRVRAMPASSIGNPDAPQWDVTPEREGDALVARVPDLELTLPPPRDDGAITSAERMRRRMSTSALSAMASNHAEAVVYVTSKLIRAGKGPIEIQAETTAADGSPLTASSKNGILVKPALREPLLPEWADAHARKDRHHGEQYEGREVAIGWLAFDRAWSDVRDVVTGMVADLSGLLMRIAHAEPARERVESMSEAEPVEADGFGVDVLRKGGEHISFPAPIAITPSTSADSTWARVIAELERGANVSLRKGGPDTRMHIEIVHQPEGSNYFPNPDEKRYPCVELWWSCPRPTVLESARSLGEIAMDLLTRAGNTDGNLGGVAFCAGAMTGVGSLETPYECLVGTRMVAKDRAWLATHVRSPGHRVLVPAGAMRKLGGDALEVKSRALAHGVLLSSADDDPFRAQREPMERAVLSLVGEANA